MHRTTGNRQWCSSFGADEKETRLAIPLFVDSLHGRTGLELVQRCIPFAGSKRVVVPRLGIASKTEQPRDGMRMRSINRFRPVYQVRCGQSGTTRDIPRRHPRQILPRRNKIRDTCRLAPDRLPSENGFASSSRPNRRPPGVRLEVRRQLVLVAAAEVHQSQWK